MAALPTMRADLGLGARAGRLGHQRLPVVSAACIIPGGRAATSRGAAVSRSPGSGLFVVASAMIATAPLAVAAADGRALQGLAAALAVPGTLAAIGEAVSPGRRAAAMGAGPGSSCSASASARCSAGR